MLQLHQQGTSFLVIEPVKGEYSKKLAGPIKGLTVLNFKQPFIYDKTRQKQAGRKGFLRFNPLVVPEKIMVGQHISYVKSCIGAAFPLPGATAMVLEIALRDLYRSKGFGLFEYGGKKQGRRYPTVAGLFEALERYVDALKDNDTKVAFRDQFLRRFQILIGGPIGHAIEPELWEREFTGEIPNSRDHDGFNLTQRTVASLTGSTAVLDLEDLADDDEKALIMAFVLTMIYEYRLGKGAQPGLVHVTVIEEAHRLLSSAGLGRKSSDLQGSQTEDSKTKAIKLFMDMLAEIRSYGEGLVVVEQIPTKLISDVVKNTNLKIVHRLPAADDREYLGAAMNLDELQQRYIINLKRGEAVLYEEGLDNPVMVRMRDLSGQWSQERSTS